MSKSQDVIKRRALQWSLVPLVLLVIGLGWKYPILGYAVPIVMVGGMIGGVLRGRYVCGNLCPRGSLYDRLIPAISPKRKIPAFLRKMPFRWTMVAALMGFMVFRLAQNPTDPMHWGRVFWLMCVVTTVIGVALSLVFHPRTWCSFCPMGTFQNSFGGNKHPLQIDASSCRECGVCEKACPIGLEIVKFKPDGQVLDRDCLQCPECANVCPKGALSWPDDHAA